MVKKRRVTKYGLAKLFIPIITFFCSIFVGQHYVSGDQLSYRDVYESIGDYDFIVALAFYKSKIETLEFGHFLLIWLFSNVLEKDVFVAISNALFSYLLLAYFKKINVSLLVVAVLIFSNYYLFVLYFSAERLKFAIMFLFIALLNYEKGKMPIFFLLASVLTHAQTLMIFVSFLCDYILNQCKKMYSSGVVSKYIFIPILLFGVSGFVLFDHLLLKIPQYFGHGEWVDLVRVSLFLSLSLLYSKKPMQTIVIFSPLFVFCLMFSGDRVNIFAYLFFMYYALNCRRGLNLGVLATTAYFGVSGFGFIYNVLEHGDGFYQSLAELIGSL